MDIKKPSLLFVLQDKLFFFELWLENVRIFLDTLEIFQLYY